MACYVLFVRQCVCICNEGKKSKQCILTMYFFVHRIITDKNNFVLPTFPTEGSSRTKLFKGCCIYFPISQHRNRNLYIINICWMNKWINKILLWYINFGQCHWNKLLCYSGTSDRTYWVLWGTFHIFTISVVETSGILERSHILVTHWVHQFLQNDVAEKKESRWRYGL